jgi:hypothetical protein
MRAKKITSRPSPRCLELKMAEKVDFHSLKKVESISKWEDFSNTSYQNLCTQEFLTYYTFQTIIRSDLFQHNISNVIYNFKNTFSKLEDSLIDFDCRASRMFDTYHLRNNMTKFLNKAFKYN